jgi:ABC-type phosphate/phosphonate transport system permease subunit
MQGAVIWAKFLASSIADNRVSNELTQIISRFIRVVEEVIWAASVLSLFSMRVFLLILLASKLSIYAWCCSL